MMEAGGNGWNRYERLVLSEIADLKVDLAEARAEIVACRIEIATLKVKSGLWGAGAGFIPAALMVVVTLALGGAG
jgi:hypothetical protein